MKSKETIAGTERPEHSPFLTKTGYATPRTNEAAKQALEMLVACNSAEDFNSAVKNMTKHLLSTVRELEIRVSELESHLRAVCGLTVESGTKKIVETMNAAEASINTNNKAHV